MSQGLIGFALSGKAATGKTTLADWIVRRIESGGLPSQRVSFADPLKKEVFDIYGKKKGDAGARELLQSHGQERRKEDSEYWLRQMERLVHSLIRQITVPVIDDVRLYNEASWSLDYGFYLIKMDSTLEDRAERLHKRGEDASVASSPDISETDLDGKDIPYHHVVYNRQDTTCLHCVAEAAVAGLGRWVKAESELGPLSWDDSEEDFGLPL